ncbi:MAG: S-layer homology domain-containing protein [Oscillospiraceae bacterium]|jgi:hypothetical protein|nr:S-layer homology domain-containing protein [Oscillospiraceae bacterium]
MKSSMKKISKSNLKRRIAVCVLALSLLAAALALPAGAAADAGTAIEKTARYLGAIESPAILSGDWPVFAVAKSGYYAPPGFYASYKKSVAAKLSETKGVLHERKYTEYSRLILALTAIGEDARSFGGYDLTAKLLEYDKVRAQGINGPAWALIALDCAPEYGAARGGDNRYGEIKERYLADILSRQRTDGRFTLAGGGADKTNEPPEADVTAMVLLALAPYRERREVSDVIDRALGFLSAIQQPDGGYKSRDVSNCESAAQVITALGALGIDIDDKRFTKNGKTALDALLSFALADGSFEHTKDGGVDLMATQQALCAMISADKGISVYGAMTLGAGPAFSKIAAPAVSRAGKTFPDIAGKSCEAAVRALAERGIIDGATATEFRPSDTVTRAQFAAITARALGFELPESGPGGSVNIPDGFSDVPESAWYARYVYSAQNYGLITGRSPKIFDPEGRITRSEAALLLERAAKLLGYGGRIAITTAAESRVTRGELAVGLHTLLRAAGALEG